MSNVNATISRRAILVCGLSALPLLAANPATAAEKLTIHMKTNNKFDPASQRVKAGDTVEWVNDGVKHTATPNAGQPDPFKGSPELKKVGEKYSVVITGAPRTIKYHCEVHGAAMSGEIVVVP
jgi:plastocyanin